MTDKAKPISVMEKQYKISPRQRLIINDAARQKLSMYNTVSNTGFKA
jgi:hypothetical protein